MLTYVYFGDSTQLTYLRSRFYASGTGRFLTRDTWMGDYQNPLTLNAWNYTSSNPINYTDPSGHYPVCECYQRPIPDWWENKSHLYVEGYGYFESGHMGRGWDNAKFFVEGIEAALKIGRSYGGMLPLPRAESGEHYWVDYVVSAKIKTKDQIYGVAYGIFMDFELGYEKYQTRRFFSAFAPEDLPSDHLGFWAYVHGLKRSDTAFLLECLGKVTDYGTSPFAGVVIDTYSTATSNGFSFAKNYEFLPMVTEVVNYGYGASGTKSRNIPWPAWLEIQPISSGPDTWQVRDRSHK